MHSPHVLQTGVVHVFTFKEGLLSRLAHDLRVSVPRFEVELRTGGAVHARFDVLSARVDGVAKGDVVDASRFSAQDTAMIERNMRESVLNAARFPTIDFHGEVQPAGAGWTVRGELELTDRRRAIDVPVLRAGSTVVAALDVQPSLWGIAPFRTMGGAIGIEDRWHVRVELALGAHAPEELLRHDAVARWIG